MSEKQATESRGVFETLYAHDVSDLLKEKNSMKYLPWSSAWAIIKTIYPTSTYRIIKTESGCNYHTDGKTCWVETELTIDGETQTEQLAVMNYKNASIPFENVTSVDVNKSIKRCFVKNAALFGLGLSLWNGEELSEAAKEKKKKEKQEEEAGLKELRAEIIVKAKKLIEQGVNSDTIYLIVSNISGYRNPNSIKDIDSCKNVLEALKGVETPAKSKKTSKEIKEEKEG